MDDSILSLENVWRVYDRGRLAAVADVTLSVARGEHLAVRGPSGSGKSTLLHLACGLDRPTRGAVLFEGAEPSPGQWRRYRARRIGFVFQSFQLLPTLTARQNVEIPMLGVVSGSRKRRMRTEELLEQVGLADRAGHRPAKLSGGERQRVAIARGLANSPDLILADEPTGNLDSHSAAEVLDLLEDLRRRRGAALVVVTHDITVATRAGRTMHMLDGRIDHQPAPQEGAECTC